MPHLKVLAGPHLRQVVIEVLDEAIIARCVELVELLAEEFIGVPLRWQEVQAVSRVRAGDVARVDLQDAVPRPRLPCEVRQRLIFLGDILEGLGEEMIEVVLVGDLLLDVQDSQLEVLQQPVLLLFPLGEVEEVVGVA